MQTHSPILSLEGLKTLKEASELRVECDPQQARLDAYRRRNALDNLRDARASLRHMHIELARRAGAKASNV